MKKKLLSVLAIIVMSVLLFGVYSKGSASPEVVPVLEYKIDYAQGCYEMVARATIIYDTSTGRPTSEQPVGTMTWAFPTPRNPSNLPLCPPTRVATVTPWLTLPNVGTFIPTGGSIYTNTFTNTGTGIISPTRTNTAVANGNIGFQAYSNYISTKGGTVTGSVQCNWFDSAGVSHYHNFIASPDGTYNLTGQSSVRGECLGQYDVHVPDEWPYTSDIKFKIDFGNSAIWEHTWYTLDAQASGEYQTFYYSNLGEFENANIRSLTKYAEVLHGTDPADYSLYFRLTWSYSGFTPTPVYTQSPTLTLNPAQKTATAAAGCYDPNLDPDPVPWFGFDPPTIWYGPCTALVPHISIPISEAMRAFIPLLPESLEIPELGFCITYVHFAAVVMGIGLQWILSALAVYEFAAFIINELRS